MQLGETMRDFVERARVDRQAPARLVDLAANAVVLIFDEERAVDRAADLLGRLDRRGQHKLERVEQPHPRRAEPAMARQQRRLADVAQQHIGPLHLPNRDAGVARQGIFELALLQADPQVAAHDLDDVLGLERRGLA